MSRFPRECAVMGIPFPENKADLEDGKKYLVLTSDCELYVLPYSTITEFDGFNAVVAYTLPQYSAGRIVKKETEEQIKAVFDCWQGEQGLRKWGRGFNLPAEAAIKKALKQYEAPEVVLAIRHYATILRGPEYYFKHKWTLVEFLTRKNALPNFVDAEVLQNFRKDRIDRPAETIGPANRYQVLPRLG